MLISCPGKTKIAGHRGNWIRTKANGIWQEMAAGTGCVFSKSAIFKREGKARKEALKPPVCC